MVAEASTLEPASAPDPLLYTMKQACAALTVSRHSIYRLIAAGELQSIHLGRAVRFRPADIQAIVDSRTKRDGKPPRSRRSPNRT